MSSRVASVADLQASQWRSDLSLRAFATLATLLPLAFLAVHAHLGHGGDIAFFHEWYLAAHDGLDFYRAGPGINYPIVGVLFVCGPAVLVERITGAPLSLPTFWLVLKASLALAEVGLIFAARALLRALDAPRPNASALALWLLPSTWAAGAYFGQIDVWGTALLALALAALTRYRQDGRVAALVVGLSALHAAILLKPLTLFSVPAIVLLLALGLRERRDKGHLALALVSPLVWFAPDAFLSLPDGYASHLAFALLGRGLSHGSLAVTNGASLWSLFAVGDTPAEAVRFLGLSSLLWGAALFGLAVLVAALGVYRSGASSASLLRFAGICQLAMATLLTGVHERYLVHAAALLFLSLRVENVRGLRLGWMLATLIVWGVYVLSSLHYDAFAGWLHVFALAQPAAVLSLGWLIIELAAPLTGARRQD